MTTSQTAGRPFDAVLCDLDNVIRFYDMTEPVRLERAAGLTTEPRGATGRRAGIGPVNSGTRLRGMTREGRHSLRPVPRRAFAAFRHQETTDGKTPGTDRKPTESRRKSGGKSRGTSRNQ
ncbi:hypothetical protein ACWIG5_29660 [Streptomyces lydicus]